jgi:hypothetical protein
MATVKTAGRRFTPPWRFRLRTVLVVISAICLLGGWQAERLRRRARAVELIKHWGLCMGHEELAANGLLWRVIPDSVRPVVVQGTANFVGVASGPYLTDDWLDCSRRRAGSRVWLGGIRRSTVTVSDAAGADRKRIVAAIAEFRELKLLDVPFNLDDDDLQKLSRLAGLEYLSFEASGLSEAGIRSLRKFRKLIRLTVSLDEPCSMPIEMIAALCELPYLERFTLEPISDDMLSRISAVLPRVKVNPAWRAEEPATAGP